MKLSIQRKLRDLSLHFLWWTDSFLGTNAVCRAIDDSRWDDAQRLLDEMRCVWGDDPEVIRLQTFLSFMRE